MFRPFDPYNTNTIEAIRDIDPSFKVHKNLAEATAAPHRFIFRCETKYMSFLTFESPHVVDMLKPGRESAPNLHEIIDGAAPFRFCFDIEREIHGYDYCADEFAAEYNKSLQDDEDFMALLDGREARKLAPVAVDIEMFYRMKVAWMIEQTVEDIQRMLPQALSDYMGVRNINSVCTLGYDAKTDLPFCADVIEGRPIIGAADMLIINSSSYMPRIVKVGEEQKTAPPKISFHVVFPTLFVASHLEGEDITKYCRQLLGDSELKLFGYDMVDRAKALADSIDVGLIKSSFSLRAPGCCKPGDPLRVLQPYGSRGLSARELLYGLLQRGLTEKQLDAALCIKLNLKKREHVGPQINDAHATAEALINKYPQFLGGWTFYRFSQGAFRFRRMAVTQACPICKEVCSQTDNVLYVVPAGARYYLRCSRDKQRRFEKLTLGGEEAAAVVEAAAVEALRVENLTERLGELGVLTSATIAETETINRAHLEDSALNALKAGAQTILIRSGMGTGKTEQLRGVIDECERVGYKQIFMGSFRKAFTREKAADLNLETYLEQPTGSFVPKPRFICQYESFFRIGADYYPDVVILDEIESILEQIQSNQGGGRAIMCLETLERIASAAPILIVMDANLNKSTAKYFLKIRPDVRPHIIVNEYKKPRAVRVHMFPGELNNEIVNGFANPNFRAAVCSDRRDYLKALQKLLESKNLLNADQVKIVTADTSEAFMAECAAAGGINEYLALKNYRLFAFNTTILAGISITHPFATVFANFSARFITPFAAFQLIGRIRAMETLHIYAQDFKAPPTTFEEEAALTFCLDGVYDRQFFRTYDRLLPLPKLLVRHRVQCHNSRVNGMESLMALWQDAGAEIQLVAPTLHWELISEQLKQVREEHNAAIAAADFDVTTNALSKELRDLAFSLDIPRCFAKLLTPEDVKALRGQNTASAWKTLRELNKCGSFDLLQVRAELMLRRPRSATEHQTSVREQARARNIIKGVKLLRELGVPTNDMIFTSPRRLTGAERDEIFARYSDKPTPAAYRSDVAEFLKQMFSVKLDSRRIKTGRTDITPVFASAPIMFDAVEKCYYIEAQRMHMTGRIIIEDRAAYEAENEILDYKRGWDRFQLTEPIEDIVARYAANPIMFVKADSTAIMATGAALHKKEDAKTTDADEIAEYMDDGVDWRFVLGQLAQTAEENVARVEPAEWTLEAALL